MHREVKEARREKREEKQETREERMREENKTISSVHTFDVCGGV